MMDKSMRLRIRKMVRDEVMKVNNVTDGRPNDQKIENMHKEVKKIASKFSKFRNSANNSNYKNEFNLWSAANKAENILDEVLTASSNASWLSMQGMIEASIDESLKADKKYKKALKDYNKIKKLYLNLK